MINMELKFQNVTKDNRKELLKAMSEIVGMAPVYKGVPSCAYAIDNFIITKDGTVEHKDELHSDYLAPLLDDLAKQGFEVEDTLAPAEQPQVDEPAEQANDGPTPIPEIDSATWSVPDDMDTTQFDNLVKLVNSKATLLKKAIGEENLDIGRDEGEIYFPWFTREPTPEEVDAYGKLIAALCKKAKECARVVAEDKTPENEKFTMRVWLMGLGMMGKEYANARKQLSKNLTGDSSWRFGKPEKKAEPQEVTAPDAETIEGIPSTDELNRRRNRVTK